MADPVARVVEALVKRAPPKLPMIRGKIVPNRKPAIIYTPEGGVRG
jgi:hypothetical protein